ncbi:hypothetical protein DsansV1_C27g0197251 [Dioscorea sansibarensis]
MVWGWDWLGGFSRFYGFLCLYVCVLARVVWGGGSALMMVLLRKYNAYQSAIPCFFIFVPFFLSLRLGVSFHYLFVFSFCLWRVGSHHTVSMIDVKWSSFGWLCLLLSEKTMYHYILFVLR